MILKIASNQNIVDLKTNICMNYEQ